MKKSGFIQRIFLYREFIMVLFKGFRKLNPLRNFLLRHPFALAEGAKPSKERFFLDFAEL